jgi:hypothetical protein
MSGSQIDSRPAVSAPRAAAVAGVVFSVLLLVGLALIRLSVPDDTNMTGTAEPRDRRPARQ